MSRQQTSNKNDPNKRSYAGQPSIVSLFPSIRGRTDTCYSFGSTIPQIRSHLLEKVPGLKSHGVLLPTARRFSEASTKRNKAHARYENYTEAQIGVKNNCYREYHEDSHYLFGRSKKTKARTCIFIERRNCSHKY